jgi:glycosyltransferase involved in cell wall biosynthesis
MGKQEAGISVVVPFFEDRRYIGRCVDALLSQDYPQQRVEVFMIDNNSTDGSAEIVRQAPGVKLLSETKQGAYAARNRGIREATGEIIAFTDADCLPGSTWLRCIHRAMSDTDARIVLGKREYASSSLGISMLAEYEAEKIDYVCAGSDKQIYYGYTNNMAVRRTLFDQFGLFPEMARGADTVFVRKVVDHFDCESVRYSPDVLVRHMEINHIWNYYQKRAIYGKSYERYRKVRSARSLSYAERTLIMRRTIKKNAYSLPRILLFSLLLAIGSVCFDLGRLSGRPRNRT